MLLSMQSPHIKTNTYSVKIERFEGPLDLLLKLIEEQKLDITSVSLARVAEEYLVQLGNLRHLDKPQEFGMAHMIDFLVIASELLLIKSEMLLPKLSPREQEEESNLVERLQEFKKFKEVSVVLREMMGHGDRYFERHIPTLKMLVCKVSEDVTAARLYMSMARLTEKLKPVAQYEQRIFEEPRVTLREKIAFIEKNLRTLRTFHFSRVAAQDELKIDIIVSFLAILELAKQAGVQAHQEKAYADIKLSYV